MVASGVRNTPLLAAVGLSLLSVLLALVALIGNQSSGMTTVLASVKRHGEPHVGQVLHNVKVETTKNAQRKHHAHRVLMQPLVTAATEAEARKELKGTPLSQLGAPTQQLRYTGSYGDTSYVVKAPEGDPATVYAHNSIWPRKVDPKMPYVEMVHADGTPYMQPLTVYAPPGGAVVSSVMPGTAARPPIPTRFATLPEADDAPLDNTVYQCQPSGYMVGPVGYHCTPACKDSALWRSDYGDCSIYQGGITGGGFKDYCGSDKDIAGVPAAVACPVSCGTCGIGVCYKNDKFQGCSLSTYSTDTSAQDVDGDAAGAEDATEPVQ